MENVNIPGERQSLPVNGKSMNITGNVLEETKIPNVKSEETVFSTGVSPYVPDLDEVESVELREARRAIRKQRVSYKFCVEKALKEMRECIEHSRSTLQSMEKKSEGVDISCESTRNLPKRRKLSLADLIPSSSKNVKK